MQIMFWQVFPFDNENTLKWNNYKNCYLQVRAQKIFNRRLEVIVTKSLQGQSDQGLGSQCYEGQDQGNACRLEGRGLENLAIAKENLWKDGQGE